MENVKVYLISLPVTVRGLTVYEIDDGQEFYTIIINSKLSSQMQCDAYDHEIEHINNHDFESMHSVDCIECLRHAV